MRNILILGAGKSSGSLIDYLAEHARGQEWSVTVADVSENLALQKTKGRPHTSAISFDYYNEPARRKLIRAADIVISMLPAAMHVAIAEDCLALKKHLVTPSYISDAMQTMHRQVKEADLIFMNEIGLDPGIDHMSSMKIIHELKAEGKTITGYRSHCGGLIAPESDDNLWHYKFTWNPRNVILAGQGEGHIQYLENGKTKKLRYEKLFSSAFELKVSGYGKFESYPNRDSLKYLKLYGLKGVKTMYRGTLRRPPFCEGWQALVDLGFTNRHECDTAAFLESVTAKLKNRKTAPGKVVEKLLHETGVIPLLALHKSAKVVPAELLQQALEHTWSIQPADKDMVVMIHEFFFKEGRKNRVLQSSLVVKGRDAAQTAMAQTVGLPLAMVTRLILNGSIKRRGVLLPCYPEIYNPILAELEHFGIQFKEKLT